MIDNILEVSNINKVFFDRRRSLNGIIKYDTIDGFVQYLSDEQLMWKINRIRRNGCRTFLPILVI